MVNYQILHIVELLDVLLAIVFLVFIILIIIQLQNKKILRKLKATYFLNIGRVILSFKFIALAGIVFVFSQLVFVLGTFGVKNLMVIHHMIDGLFLVIFIYAFYIYYKIFDKHKWVD